MNNMTNSKAVKCRRDYCSTIISLSSNSLESFRTEPVNMSLFSGSMFVIGIVAAPVFRPFLRHVCVADFCSCALVLLCY